MTCPAESVSHFGGQFRNAVSAEGSKGKAHPILSANSGSQFPLGPHRESASRSEHRFRDALSVWGQFGKYVPFRAPILGCAFHLGPQPETAGHFARRLRRPRHRTAATAVSPPISHVLDRAIQSHKTAGKTAFFTKVHAHKLTRPPQLATVHGCRLPPTDSVFKIDVKTGHLPAWLDFGQLLVS